jgi:hypothetical protein
MSENLYQPIPTAEIPMPVLESPMGDRPGREALPRILLQVAGMDAAKRTVLGMTALFALLALLEVGLLLHTSRPDPIVVYEPDARTTLVQVPR